MNQEAKCYERALKKQLRCTGGAKKRLLSQFRSSLDAYLEEYPSPTLADLQESFGPPADMAGVLMESVSEAEAAQFQKHKKWKCIAAGVLAALLLALTTYIFFWKEKPIYVIDYITEGSTNESYREVGQ